MVWPQALVPLMGSTWGMPVAGEHGVMRLHQVLESGRCCLKSKRLGHPHTDNPQPGQPQTIGFDINREVAAEDA